MVVLVGLLWIVTFFEMHSRYEKIQAQREQRVQWQAETDLQLCQAIVELGIDLHCSNLPSQREFQR
jgi:L-ribulose-5-phosphate 3-epimerase UlaE